MNIIELAREVADKDKEDPVSHDGLITLTYEEMERFTAAVIKARDAELESTLRVALEALEKSRGLEPVDVDWVKGQRKAAIKQIKEVLHGSI